MSTLFEYLKKRIKNEGPLSLETYMAEALGHPQHGYYQKGDPFGISGDFITAPEISQMFGELLGLWSAVSWQQLSSPLNIHLIELGPGRGTLMADALRAVSNIAPFWNALDVHLVEKSLALRECQKTTLSAMDCRIDWYDRFEEVPRGPFILLANEFLDALPVRQFANKQGGWYERLIGLTASGEQLEWTISDSKIRSDVEVSPALGCGVEGQIWEISSVVQEIVRAISRVILEQKGVALFIDYGYMEQVGMGTLQAVKNHQYTDPLSNPGHVDLTAHVDFGMVARIAENAGVRVSGPVAQGTFLKNLGIDQRADGLKKAASEEQKTNIAMAVRRLTNDHAMGQLFKVIALSHPGVPEPGGF